MQRERYPGEQRGLRLFLEELAPVARDRLGPNSLLHHAIKRALRHATLERLRHARRLFNALPRPTRQDLQAGIVGRPEASPRRDALLQDLRAHEPRPFVCFEGDGAGVTRAGLRHELAEDVPLRVLVRPDTLPSAAARALRDLADTIEDDRRLLSSRHWRASRLLSDEGGGLSEIGRK